MGFKIIKENILSANDNIAESIRASMKNTLIVNIISSPGAGKTAFLEKTGPALKQKDIKFAVITGDCFTARDAQRLDAAGLPVIQINTGNACHIDAGLIQKALEQDIITDDIDLVIIENVGNLVCPAEFDLGEDIKIAFFSTTEGSDKPIKYPLIVQESAMAIINKIDLLGYLDFDLDFTRDSIKKVNPKVEILEVSAKTGQGVQNFVEWIMKKIKDKKEREHEVFVSGKE